MNEQHIAQAEIGRALAAAEVYFGYPMSLEHLQKVISSMGVTLETREEIDYLVSAQRGQAVDLGVLINVADSLTDKFETGRLEVAKGFGWLEQAGRNLNDAAKVAIGWAAVVALQVLAGCILFNVAFDRVPALEFWFYTVALVLFVGNSAVIACWAFSMGDTTKAKRYASLLGYGFAAIYAYSLARLGLDTFNFNIPVFGAHWYIVWLTHAPIIVPVARLVWIALGQEEARLQQKARKVDLFEPMTPGKIGTDLDIRLDPPDSFK
ncbi:hypothetical protein RQ595_30830 [Pseudomonas aeruginosa]|uniref:hypothetical protein n=1 Tax=Pseudomonas aeruginosa TaxID=287 RepID=UPI0028CD05E0|nr:hypothetical protein [Pseudomonas aeruginosa]MDT8222726.1 hypothetical protein [Pseudomonas aeruginosa]